MQMLEQVEVLGFAFSANMTLKISAILISRAMSASTGDGKYKALEKYNGDPEERAQFFNDMLRDITEGWRFRLGISFPVIARS